MLCTEAVLKLKGNWILYTNNLSKGRIKACFRIRNILFSICGERIGIKTVYLLYEKFALIGLLKIIGAKITYVLRIKGINSNKDFCNKRTISIYKLHILYFFKSIEFKTPKWEETARTQSEYKR